MSDLYELYLVGWCRQLLRLRGDVIQTIRGRILPNSATVRLPGTTKTTH